jgi:PAS domain S-box-containing protein
MKETIFIIDDEENIRLALARILEREGYRTLQAESAEKAIQMLSDTTADVVISDILMQGMSGLDFLGWLTIQHPKTPAILMTGNPDLESAGAALRFKAFDYIPKPVERAKIIEVVDRAIREKRILENRENELKRSKTNELNLLLKNRDLNIQNSIILDSTSDSVITINAQGKIHSINRSTEKMFGYKPSQLIGESLSKLFPDSDRPNFEKNMSRIINQNRKAQFHFPDVNLQNQAGETLACDVSICSFSLNGEKFLAGIIRDVTEKKVIVQKLMEAERKSFLNTIAASIGHEINNSLTAIMGFIEIASQPNALSDIKDRAIQITMSQAEKLKNLTSNLLTLGKSGKGGWQDSESTECELNTCLANVLDVFEKSKRLKRCSVHIERNPEPLWVKGSEEKLGLIFSNLILNAADATQNTGEISLRTYVEGGKPMFEIKDNGIGMDQEMIQRIFEPYFTTKALGEGTGLGMFVVREVCNLYGIKIRIDSKPNSGAKFNLEFSFAGKR